MNKRIFQDLTRAVLCLLVTTLPIEGQAQALQREADKAEAIKRIMAERKFQMTSVVGKQNKAFCEGFLQDFRLQKNIEFIEPVAKADSYDDPVWQPYKASCPQLELFDRYSCEPKIYDAIMAQPPTERQREFKTACQHFRGTANFKLFLVDINNNPKDGKEHVFYYERAEGPLNRPVSKQIYGNGAYAVFDLDRCEVKRGANVHDPYSYFYKRPLENYNGIIDYRGRHYIFDLADLDGSDRDPKNPNYRLQVDGHAKFGKETKPRLGPICSYSTIVLKRK